MFIFLNENFIFCSIVQKPKRKTSESSTTDKRDKKLKPKKRGKTPDMSPERSTTPPLQSTSTSITDVFADHLIQKAKTVIEPPLSVKKAERNGGTTNDGFDIPTISEIAKKAVGAVVRRKEITELAELQKKIDQAKRQLRHMTEESDDEDFINLAAEKLDFDGELSNNGKENATDKTASSETTTEKANEAKTHQKITFDEKRDADQSSSSKKRSILNRLGTRGGNNEAEKVESTEQSKNIISLSAHRRMEQAIYVPAHRRTAESTAAIPKRSSESEKIRERSPIRNMDSRRSSRIESRLGRDRQRSREPRDLREPRDFRDHRDTRDSRDLREPRNPREPRDLREKVRQRERDVELRSGRANRDSSREDRINKSEEKPISATNRMASRVIVAPAKPEYVEEDKIDVPISSVVKVKPRPLIPRSKQASKNLLLRAVAEAQKSTALVKPAARELNATEKNTKELYTKSFRNKLQKGNIVVEIAADETETIEFEDGTNVEDLELAAEASAGEDEEEYVPKSESIDEEAFVYIPQAIHSDG